jgi:hypothetical protein
MLIQGNKIIKQIYVYDETGGDYAFFKAGIETPSKRKLFNFDIIVSNRSWLILDPYGNDFIPSKLNNRVLGLKNYTLGIDKKSGVIYFVAFTHFIDKRKRLSSDAPVRDVILHLYNSNLIVPDIFINKLDNLKDKKRPFYLSFRSFALMNFIDREIGFSDLKEEMIITLQFENESLEITKEAYRTSTKWK